MRAQSLRPGPVTTFDDFKFTTVEDGYYSTISSIADRVPEAKEQQEWRLAPKLLDLKLTVGPLE